MKDKIVYKVVEVKSRLITRKGNFVHEISSVLKKNKRKYCSCIVFDLNCAVSYEIGKLSKPKLGKLFAFSSINEAMEFKRPSQVILECKAKNARPQYKICRYFDPKEFERFWNKQQLPYNWAPNGTVCCDSIIPTKIIK